jgi:hypothetical protein
MDKQNVILKTHELEVIGQGGMVYEPCQIGEWWVMPADQYTGTIPDDIMKKWDNFKALGIPVLGYLIADDMRDVLIKREKEAEELREMERQEIERLRIAIEREQKEAERARQAAELERRKEAAEKAAKEAAEIGGKVLAGIAVAAGAVAVGIAALPIAALLAVLRFDPILIAVMPDGRWICLGAWWN